MAFSGDQPRRAARRIEASGGEKERTTAGMAGRDDVPSSLMFFYDGRGTRRAA